jgi:C4-dicarboxylate transporter/malic acid transport protein
MRDSSGEGLGGPRRFLSVLSSRSDDGAPVLLGPNWFASAMGTAIVAVAAATLPIVLPGVGFIANLAWGLSVAVLALLLVVVPIHWMVTPGAFRRLLDDVVMAQFFGAPPMALMAVGAATLLVGSHHLGETLAFRIDAVLWGVGTLLGLVSAVFVPFLLFTQHEVRPDGAFGGWLMPVVPPMVSATTGGLLLRFVPEGQARQTLLFGGYALFGASLVASLIVVSMIWSRLAHFGSSGSARVPTLWIVLGPIGQSITAAGVLGAGAALAVPAPLADALRLFAVVYGVPMWGFLLLWMALATLLTARAWRRKMPFALTWWSFTFPVATCVTGTNQLARHTGLVAFHYAAVALFALLVTAWVAVAVGTLLALGRGELVAPGPSKPAVASKG